MEIINNVTPEAQANAKAPSWYAAYQDYCKKTIDGDRLCRSLFGDTGLRVSESNQACLTCRAGAGSAKPGLTAEEKATVLTELYWYASDMQDVTTGADLYEFLTDEELYNMWTTVNYRMYVCNSWCPL